MSEPRSDQAAYDEEDRQSMVTSSKVTVVEMLARRCLRLLTQRRQGSGGGSQGREEPRRPRRRRERTSPRPSVPPGYDQDDDDEDEDEDTGFAELQGLIPDPEARCRNGPIDQRV